MISSTETHRLACQSEAARAPCRGRLRERLPQCCKALVVADIAGTGARDCNR
ncbi:hypothetical protein AURDEDRAFT_167746 [Auricularia subglabra TFB-10046 SS5]|nr:hypothetical protein AURDEDRAFT_167746 [Auricularia subglabra TFB-10046 SS5]